MKLVLDAMGGDFAPEQVVLGAVEASSQLTLGLILVGIESELKKYVPAGSRIEIVHAEEVVGMDEKPVEALRTKKNSSLSVSVNLVKEGLGHAMISAGNTGAATASSLLGWRQIPGIHRPAIGSTMPCKGGQFLMLDAGASPDVDPEHLVEFAQMGMAYSKCVMGRTNPRVHLLNIGEEPGKGNAFAKQVQELMAPYDWFAGNIEGKDLFKTKPDVVVCDAFVGNIVLKTAEGVAEFMMSEIKDGLPKSKLAQLPYLPMRKLFAPLKKKMDYAEYGGSPLLGLNHLCVICHGRSNAKAIKNALLTAEVALKNDLIARIRQSVSP